MKSHVGVAVGSGIVHSVEAITARVHNSQVWTDKGLSAPGAKRVLPGRIRSGA
jgi:hypothetical protein